MVAHICVVGFKGVEVYGRRPLGGCRSEVGDISVGDAIWCILCSLMRWCEHAPLSHVIRSGSGRLVCVLAVAQARRGMAVGGWGLPLHSCPVGWSRRSGYAVRVAEASSRTAAGRACGGVWGGGGSLSPTGSGASPFARVSGGRVCVLQRSGVDCGAAAVAASARLVVAGRWWAGKPLVRAHVRVVAGSRVAVPQRALAAWRAYIGSGRVIVPLACVQPRGCWHGLARAVRVLTARRPPPVPSRDCVTQPPPPPLPSLAPVAGSLRPTARTIPDTCCATPPLPPSPRRRRRGAAAHARGMVA
jgi:hypothetical protein